MLSQDLQRFAIEFRKLAHTMPGGVEDSLIRLICADDLRTPR